MKNLNIICFAGNLYDQTPWTNRQQIMTKLVELGNKVLYIEPPKSIFIQMAKLLFRYKPEQRTKWWFKRLKTVEKRQENLYIFSLIKFVPTKYRLLRRLNYLLNLPEIKKQMKELKMNDPVLWIYSPDAVTLVRKMNGKFVLYDCVDEYSAQPYYQKNFVGIEKDEIELLKKSHCVFTCSPYLQQNKGKFNKNTFFIANAADYEHFSKAQNENTPIAQDIRSIPKPIIGFIGAIDNYKLDFELIQYLAQRRPDLSIVLIGGIGEAEKKSNINLLKKNQNIYILGKKDYHVLPNYIKAFNVAIIPYVRNKYTKYFHAPLKLFELLSSGKPIVVSGMPVMEEFKEVVRYTSTYSEFEKAICEYLRNDVQENKKLRIAVAKENTWQKKAEKQIKIIKRFIKGENYSANRS